MRYSTTALSIFTMLLLVACATPPRKVETQAPVPVVEALSINQSGAAATPSGGYLPGDGPGADAPANLDSIPDAVPRNEPLHPYANRQYAALGKLYIPQSVPGNYKKRGIASWYGKKFNGQRTSSGETYNMYAMTAAHPTLPIPSYARVTNLSNGKSVVVRINDRGPFLHDRIIDLSYTAAYKLGIINNGSSEVEVESLVPESTEPASVVANNAVSSTPLPSGMPSVISSATMAATSATSNAATAASVPVEPKPATPVPASQATTGSAISVVPAPIGNVYLQLGAFRQRQGAEDLLAKMRARLGSDKQLTLFEKGGLVRVHYGPYSSKDAALAAAEKLKAQLGFKPVITEH